MPYLIPPEPNHDTLQLAGDWSVMALGEIDRELQAAEPGLPKKLTVDGAQLTGMDLSAATLLVDWLKSLQQNGVALKLDNIDDGHRRLMELVGRLKPEPADRNPPPKERGGIYGAIVGLGQAADSLGAQAYQFTAFSGQAFAALGRLALHPRRIRGTSVVFHMYEIGFRAIPIVALMSFLISIVTGYQGIVQLRQFGAEIYTIDLVAISMLRELAVLVTAIMVAGRSGSAFTAELGVMKTNEEVDALRVMGLDVFEVLVLPRLVAILLVLPLLTIVADLAGLLGGYLIAMTSLDVPLVQYLNRVHEAVKLRQFWLGMVKAPFFALTIGLVGCLRGLQVTGAAEAVGRYTTRAVVDAIFMVITIDAIFSIIFSALKL